MSLLEEWRQTAYSEEAGKEQYQLFWANYFNLEKGFYQSLLTEDKIVAGTIPELAEKYDLDTLTMVGVLDGINESLKEPNPIETMDETTELNLDYDKEKLYSNMVEARANWLYNLSEWNDLLTEERRKELYKKQKSSTTVVKGPKVGRNDPCPCGSGKKFKFCCGKNK